MSSRAACITLVTLMLTVMAIAITCVLGDCWRDMKMAELGYERGAVPGFGHPVWMRPKP